MTAAEIFKELDSLPRPDRAGIAKRALETLCADNKTVERIMRRVENPDIPPDVWRGIEDAEDGRIVDMEMALQETASAQMKYRFEATETFWENFYNLSPSQKESTRNAWQIFKQNPFDTRLRAHKIHRLPALCDERFMPWKSKKICA